MFAPVPSIHFKVSPGDLLATLSDGVTEATRGEEEYGEARLIQLLRNHPHVRAEHFVTVILPNVQEFSGGVQNDLTAR